MLVLRLIVVILIEPMTSLVSKLQYFCLHICICFQFLIVQHVPLLLLSFFDAFSFWEDVFLLD